MRYFAPVAQLDRVFGYEPKGRGFESLLARQAKHHRQVVLLFLYKAKRGSIKRCKKTVRGTVFPARAFPQESESLLARHVGAKSALLRLIFCLRQKDKLSAFWA